MVKKLPRSGRIILLTSVLLGTFASSTFAHNCYNANKPDGAGAVTLEDVWVNKGGHLVLPGGFVDPSVFGAPEGYKDVFIHNYLGTAAKKGSTENGVQEYVVPEE
jgi:hypothetical protein